MIQLEESEATSEVCEKMVCKERGVKKKKKKKKRNSKLVLQPFTQKLEEAFKTLLETTTYKKPIATFLEIFCNGFEIWFTKVFVFLVRML
jgi:hypothetical protein